MENKGKFIEKIGRSCVSQRILEVWDSKIWSNLMRPCLQNRCEGYYMIRILYFTRCLKPNIFLMERCLMPKCLPDHMPGRVY